MAKTKSISDRLVLLHRDGSYSTEPAPEGFDWQHYPREITLGEFRGVYIGTLDGRPHYREVSDERKD